MLPPGRERRRTVNGGTVPTLEVVDLVKHFGSGRRIGGSGTVHAVDGVSFSIAPGELLGLVGESGSGKSTVANCVIRLLEPTEGTIRLKGDDITHVPVEELRPIRHRIQLVFQDPYSSLDPRMTWARSSAALRLQRLPRLGARPQGGRAVRQGRARADFGSATRTTSPVASGSASVSRALSPVAGGAIADEPVSALDVSVRASILNLLRDPRRARVLVSLHHSRRRDGPAPVGPGRGHVPRQGRRDGADQELFTAPKHPYTQALLSAAVVPDPVVQRARTRIVLQGDIPSPLAPPSGCRFRTRCPLAHESLPDSAEVEPPLIDIGGGHLVSVTWSDRTNVRRS